MNILFVEDHPALRYAMSREMRVHGHTVSEAETAEMALSLLAGSTFDALVADIGLPGMSGDVFAAEARVLRPQLHIVFASGLEHVRPKHPAADEPIFLRKPYTWDELSTALQSRPHAGDSLKPTMNEMTESRNAAFEAFEATVSEKGVRPALAGLLERTDYRFIGIWRFQDGRANAAVHYDRENPEETRAQEVSEDATYCCYVRDSRGAFTTANAMLDPRTAEHPAKSVVLSYCGVPLLDPDGELLGTLCHYDLVPRDPEQVDLELMIQVAGHLAAQRLVPPYPSAERQ